MVVYSLFKFLESESGQIECPIPLTYLSPPEGLKASPSIPLTSLPKREGF